MAEKLNQEQAKEWKGKRTTDLQKMRDELQKMDASNLLDWAFRGVSRRYDEVHALATSKAERIASEEPFGLAELAAASRENYGDLLDRAILLLADKATSKADKAELKTILAGRKSKPLAEFLDKFK